jgi:hypothetical protein
MSKRLQSFKDSLREETFMDKIRSRVATAKKNLQKGADAYAADHKRRASQNPLKPTPGGIFDRMSKKNEELDTLKGLTLPKIKKNLSTNQKKLRKDKEKNKTFKKIDIQDNTNRGGGKNVVEDAQYSAKPGGHEWGTAKGTEYYKKLTPGQSSKFNQKPEPVKVPVEEDISGAIKDTIKSLANPSKVVRQKVKVAGRKYNPKTPLNKTQAFHAKMNRNMSHGLKQALRAKKVAWVDDVNYDEDLIEGLDKELLDYISQIEEHGFTEQDILEMEKEVDGMDLEDFLSLGGYSEDEFEDDDYNNDGALDVYDDLNITEVLTIQGRIKRRFAARRNRQKLKVARARALRRSSSPDRIKLRSTRSARNFMYKRLLRGRDKSNLPPSEKQRLEKLIKRFEPIVSRIAVRMLPQIRKKEVERLKRRGSMKSQKAKKFRVSKGGSASKYKAKKFKIKNKPTLRPKLTKKAKAVGKRK